MPLDKEIAQDLIDDFVISNDSELNKISEENPDLFNATLNALNFLSSRFGTGQKMQIVEKPMTFKKFDRFTVPHDQTGQIYMIKDIDKDKNIVEVTWFNQKENKSKRIEQSINSVIDFFNNGEWVLVDWYPLKVGDKFQNSNKRSVIYTIESIDETKNKQLQLILDNGITKEVIDKDIDSFIEDIELGFKIPIKDELEFKVGDVFRVKNSNIFDKGFKIKEIDGEKFVFESVETGLVNDDLYTTSEANKKLLDGNWEKVETISQPITNNPHDIKVGDLILQFPNEKVWEVLDIKQDVVKMMTSNNKKETGSLAILNSRIDDGSNIKLPFSIGDTFVNPTGDFYKIQELYPNNEKSIWVRVNDKIDLEVFEYSIIQNWVEDAFWMPGTKADAEQIKENLSQAIPNATQQKMAKATATPTKTPKKPLTKEEKAIKVLQKEIDGLEVIASFDDEAKEELEKKLIEIKALKSKIS